MMICLSNLIGQIKSYDVVIDSSDNYKLGDLINYEKNYYEAFYYYDALNSIDSIDNYKLPLESIDSTELYYCLISKSQNYILLFFIDKLDETKFHLFYDPISKRYTDCYQYKDTRMIFFKNEIDGNYVNSVLFIKDNDSQIWKVRNGIGAFYRNKNKEEVKKEAVAKFLANRIYFQIETSSEDPDFWNRIQSYDFKNK